jgi:choline kinase
MSAPSEGGSSLPLRPALKGNETDEPLSPRSGPAKGKTIVVG